MKDIRASSLVCATLLMTSLLLGRALPFVFAQTTSAEEGDPVQGKQVFEKRCTGCHALEENREGPRLHGVFGRTSGTATGYAYSPALVQAHIVWDESSLERWLSGPDALVPGTNMDFYVPKQQERRDLILYLKQLSAK